MDAISFDDLNNFNTKFTAKEFISYIHIHLKDRLSSSTSYKITELSYDPLYDEHLPHNTATRMWSIDFFYVDHIDIRIIVNYDTHYIMPRYQILVSYLEISFSDEDTSFVDFTNNSNVRSSFCDDKIFSIKYFIKKEEQKIQQRYAERESLLLLVNGATNNYTNETKISKKQRVLQDPMYQRELSLHFDYVEPSIPEFLLIKI
jgi:hypothetical protein